MKKEWTYGKIILIIIINKDNKLIPYFGIEEDERQEPIDSNSKMDVDDEKINEEDEDDVDNEEDNDSQGIYSEVKVIGRMKKKRRSMNMF